MASKKGVAPASSAPSVKTGGYSSINLNALHKPVAHAPVAAPKPQGPKGLVLIGFPPSAKERERKAKCEPPRPVQLKSLKAENQGNDPSVSLVPSGGLGWGKRPEAIPEPRQRLEPHGRREHKPEPKREPKLDVRRDVKLEPRREPKEPERRHTTMEPKTEAKTMEAKAGKTKTAEADSSTKSQSTTRVILPLKTEVKSKQTKDAEKGQAPSWLGWKKPLTTTPKADKEQPTLPDEVALNGDSQKSKEDVAEELPQQVQSVPQPSKAVSSYRRGGSWADDADDSDHGDPSAPSTQHASASSSSRKNAWFKGGEASTAGEAEGQDKSETKLLETDENTRISGRMTVEDGATSTRDVVAAKDRGDGQVNSSGKAMRDESSRKAESADRPVADGSGKRSQRAERNQREEDHGERNGQTQKWEDDAFKQGSTMDSDSRREDRNDSRREDRNDSRREDRNDSRREDRNDSRREDRNDSRREDRNDSRREDRKTWGKVDSRYAETDKEDLRDTDRRRDEAPKEDVREWNRRPDESTREDVRDRNRRRDEGTREDVRDRHRRRDEGPRDSRRDEGMREDARDRHKRRDNNIREDTREFNSRHDENNREDARDRNRRRDDSTREDTREFNTRRNENKEDMRHSHWRRDESTKEDIRDSYRRRDESTREDTRDNYHHRRDESTREDTRDNYHHRRDDSTREDTRDNYRRQDKGGEKENSWKDERAYKDTDDSRLGESLKDVSGRGEGKTAEFSRRSDRPRKDGDDAGKRFGPTDNVGDRPLDSAVGSERRQTKAKRDAEDAGADLATPEVNGVPDGRAGGHRDRDARKRRDPVDDDGGRRPIPGAAADADESRRDGGRRPMSRRQEGSEEDGRQQAAADGAWRNERGPWRGKDASSVVNEDEGGNRAFDATSTRRDERTARKDRDSGRHAASSGEVARQPPEGGNSRKRDERLKKDVEDRDSLWREPAASGRGRQEENSGAIHRNDERTEERARKDRDHGSRFSGPVEDGHRKQHTPANVEGTRREDRREDRPKKEDSKWFRGDTKLFMGSADDPKQNDAQVDGGPSWRDDESRRERDERKQGSLPDGDRPHRLRQEKEESKWNHLKHGERTELELNREDEDVRFSRAKDDRNTGRLKGSNRGWGTGQDEAGLDVDREEKQSSNFDRERWNQQPRDDDTDMQEKKGKGKGGKKGRRERAKGKEGRNEDWHDEGDAAGGEAGGKSRPGKKGKGRNARWVVKDSTASQHDKEGEAATSGNTQEASRQEWSWDAHDGSRWEGRRGRSRKMADRSAEDSWRGWSNKQAWEQSERHSKREEPASEADSRNEKAAAATADSASKHAATSHPPQAERPSAWGPHRLREERTDPPPTVAVASRPPARAASRSLGPAVRPVRAAPPAIDLTARPPREPPPQRRAARSLGPSASASAVRTSSAAPAPRKEADKPPQVDRPRPSPPTSTAVLRPVGDLGLSLGAGVVRVEASGEVEEGEDAIADFQEVKSKKQQKADRAERKRLAELEAKNEPPMQQQQPQPESEEAADADAAGGGAAPATDPRRRRRKAEEAGAVGAVAAACTAGGGATSSAAGSPGSAAAVGHHMLSMSGGFPTGGGFPTSFGAPFGGIGSLNPQPTKEIAAIWERSATAPSDLQQHLPLSGAASIMPPARPVGQPPPYAPPLPTRPFLLKRLARLQAGTAITTRSPVVGEEPPEPQPYEPSSSSSRRLRATAPSQQTAGGPDAASGPAPAVGAAGPTGRGAGAIAGGRGRAPRAYERNPARSSLELGSSGSNSRGDREARSSAPADGDHQVTQDSGESTSSPHRTEKRSFYSEESSRNNGKDRSGAGGSSGSTAWRSSFYDSRIAPRAGSGDDAAGDRPDSTEGDARRPPKGRGKNSGRKGSGADRSFSQERPHRSRGKGGSGKGKGKSKSKEGKASGDSGSHAQEGKASGRSHRSNKPRLTYKPKEMVAGGK